MATSTAPRHVAIIMDGNGRWAQRRGHQRWFGHVRGSARVKEIVLEADRLGVKALTLYAFSTENWKRPEAELSVLWKLLKKFLLKELTELDRNGVRLQVLGEVERLPSDVREVIAHAIQTLSKNEGLRLSFAVSYGSQREWVRAARLFAEDCLKGKHRPEDLNESMVEEYLWTSELGELAKVDVVIRTSGEQRVSNFLLWQAAYAEYFFVDQCWPDFRAKDFAKLIENFGSRERRYGGIGAK